MHICIFDKSCWRDWKQFAMPMRVHWGEKNQHYFTIPGLSAKRRMKKMWSEVWQKEKETGEWVKKRWDKKTKTYVEVERVPDNGSIFPLRG